MNSLNVIVEEMQRQAGALSTADLRDYIRACLEVLSEDIDVAQRLGPSAPSTQVITATDNVMITALATALYVRELTTRPADRQFARLWFSVN